MATGGHITKALALFIGANEEIAKAAESIVLPGADWTREDLWALYHELDDKIRHLTMIGRGYGLDLPTPWVP